MSDPNAPQSEIPLPWLATATSAQASDPNSAADANQPISGLRFEPSWADQFRCLSRMVFVRPAMASAIAIYLFGQSMFHSLTTAGLLTIRHGGFVFNSSHTSHFFRLLIRANVAWLIAVPVMTAILSSTWATIRLRFRGSSETVLLTPRQVRYLSPARNKEIAWTKIIAITEFDGDVYVFGKGFEDTIAIPRSAFSNGESARRFRDILIRLWKSVDGARFLAPELTAEFSPPTTLPAR